MGRRMGLAWLMGSGGHAVPGAGGVLGFVEVFGLAAEELLDRFSQGGVGG
jgi:hypothetical protein